MDAPAQAHFFAARLRKVWILRCVDLPRDVSKSLANLTGSAKYPPVRGWINGLPFQSTLSPGGAGRYRLHVHSRIWRKLRIDTGAVIEVTILLDSEPHELPLPPDLAAGLGATPRALEGFQSLTPAFRRQIIVYMNAAKRPRTREKRVQIIVQRMLEKAIRRKKKAASAAGGKTAKKKRPKRRVP